tara:strand:- start:47 stop:475 length:429 start_codon:yes stop_codon:yes gene_type:complete
MASYIVYRKEGIGAGMSSFRICSNCYGTRVYPWMGFMTGERYQCQDCEEILVMLLEFDTTEEYVNFLKVQSPEKFAQIEAEFKSAEKESETSNNNSEEETIESSQKSGKLSHICIFENCQKGKRGGTDYCRKHWREGHDVEF